MLDLLTFVILSAATYRIGRFLLLDDLIAGWRDQFFVRLSNPKKLNTVRLKAAELFSCAYCITVWIAAAVVAFWSLVVADEWIGWAFLLVWPAVAAGSLVFWAYIDNEG
ncbi:MAG: DUF1360 domain-containing protein [Acidimicrobiia bacterium]|nr:DUF1360 domain-containing protein [Acidimicrobiia bacterium]